MLCKPRIRVKARCDPIAPQPASDRLRFPAVDEAALQEKLRKIEALHAGATSDGEREATRLAAERIRARLAEVRAREPDVEMVYSLPDPWMRKLFLALCRRYGLKPYRRHRQRYSTVQVMAPKSFHTQTLWPEFVALAEELGKHLAAITERVVREAIHGDVSEAAESDAPKGYLPESGS
jgi:hypothetical protein